MTAEPLKPLPCPWCQSSDIDIVHVDIRQKNGQMVCMRCCGCGVTGPIETVENPNHEEPVAIAAWNRRVGHVISPEVIKQIDEECARRSLGADCGYYDHGYADALEWVLALIKGDEDGIQ